MNKQQFFTYLYFSLIVGIICFMIFMVSWLRSESKDCMANPIVWFEEKNEGTVCSCFKGAEVFSINNIRIPINTEMIINNTDP